MMIRALKVNLEEVEEVTWLKIEVRLGMIPETFQSTMEMLKVTKVAREFILLALDNKIQWDRDLNNSWTTLRIWEVDSIPIWLTQTCQDNMIKTTVKSRLEVIIEVEVIKKCLLANIIKWDQTKTWINPSEVKDLLRRWIKAEAEIIEILFKIQREKEKEPITHQERLVDILQRKWKGQLGQLNHPCNPTATAMDVRMIERIKAHVREQWPTLVQLEAKLRWLAGWTRTIRETRAHREKCFRKWIPIEANQTRAQTLTLLLNLRRAAL